MPLDAQGTENPFREAICAFYISPNRYFIGFCLVFALSTGIIEGYWAKFVWLLQKQQ